MAFPKGYGLHCPCVLCPCQNDCDEGRHCKIFTPIKKKNKYIFSIGGSMTKKRFVGKYETILDHNPTPEEFEEIVGVDWEDRLEFIQIMNTMTPHAGWADISFLYEKRGDLEMAKKYDKPLPQWELNRQIIDYVY